MFTSILEKSRSKLWASQISIPARITRRLANSASRRVWCSINGSSEWQCALLPVGGGFFVISANRSLCKKLKLEYGMKAEVSLRKDETKYGLPMPEELKELFRQEKDGNRLFHALTVGKQRTLLYMIGRGKSSDQKIERAITIIRHLKENKGKINYRQLGEEIKKKRLVVRG